MRAGLAHVAVVAGDERGVPLIWALLMACTPQVPPVCVDMCAAATELYGGCLDDWGVGWSDAGYDDQAAFRDSCETWAWEVAVLEQDAVKQGTIDQAGSLEPECQARLDVLTAPDATCSAYTEMAWDELPWQ